MLYYYHPNHHFTSAFIMTNYTLDRETHTEIRECIEDTVEYLCDDNMISGELMWIVVETLAQAKIAQIRGEIR
jgi:hypothetical protein